MSGYSGTTSFEFEIERYKNKKTGKLEAYLLPGIDESGYDYQIHTLSVEGRASFSPGKMFGTPENCYPDESEVEIISVMGPDGKDWEDQLTHSEREYILTMIDENVQSDDGIYDPDFKHDDWRD